MRVNPRSVVDLLGKILIAVIISMVPGHALAQGISLKDYGACGNNICDDTSAINQWLAAVSAAHGLGIWPAGTYKITAPLVVITTGNWAVQGAGGYQTVLNYAGSSTATTGSAIRCRAAMPTPACRRRLPMTA